MSQRELAILSLAATIACCSPAAADTESAALAVRYPELHRAYYDMAVCEYCGFVDAEIVEGHRREVADLVARDLPGETQHRKLRIHAWTAADLEYGNRGLGGFRNWCRTEGVSAARRFLDYHAQALADDAEAE